MNKNDLNVKMSGLINKLTDTQWKFWLCENFGTEIFKMIYQNQTSIRKELLIKKLKKILKE